MSPVTRATLIAVESPSVAYAVASGAALAGLGVLRWVVRAVRGRRQETWLVRREEAYALASGPNVRAALALAATLEHAAERRRGPPSYSERREQRKGAQSAVSAFARRTS